MPKNATQTTEETPEPQATPVPTPPTASSAPEETDWKAEARKWESRAKENLATAKANEGAAQRLAEIEESAKSEEQKQAEALQAAQEKLAEYEHREQVASWASEVAAETGVPVTILRGSTKEEILAHAEDLKSLGVGQPIPEPAPQPQSYVVPTIGVQPDTTGNLTISQQIAAAEKAGDTATVSTLKAIQLGAAAPSA